MGGPSYALLMSPADDDDWLINPLPNVEQLVPLPIVIVEKLSYIICPEFSKALLSSVINSLGLTPVYSPIAPSAVRNRNQLILWYIP